MNNVLIKKKNSFHTMLSMGIFCNMNPNKIAKYHSKSTNSTNQTLDLNYARCIADVEQINRPKQGDTEILQA